MIIVFPACLIIRCCPRPTGNMLAKREPTHLITFMKYAISENTSDHTISDRLWISNWFSTHLMLFTLKLV